MGNSSIIQLQDITRTYQMGETQVHALRGISLQVDPRKKKSK